MSVAGQPYTSGDWLVKEGKEQEFVAAWNAFTSWSIKQESSVATFTLIRKADDPRHYVSFAAWKDEAALKSWMSRPDFAQLYAQARDLCDTVVSGVYLLESVQTRDAVTA